MLVCCFEFSQWLQPNMHGVGEKQYVSELTDDLLLPVRF